MIIRLVKKSGQYVLQEDFQVCPSNGERILVPCANGDPPAEVEVIGKPTHQFVDVPTPTGGRKVMVPTFRVEFIQEKKHTVKE